MQINTTGTQPQAQTAATSASSQLGTDINSFLRLLTAQLSNQDPLAPTDSSTFVTQLAQLSQVEQSIASNQSLELLTQQFSSFTELSDIQLIGREVTLRSSQLDLNQGQASIQYELFGNAQNAAINIIGLDGSVVRTLTNLPTSQGQQHTVSWDGLGASGQQIADGTYRFEVIGLDANLDAVPYESFINTNVEELTFNNGASVLHLRNGEQVSSASILAVR